MDMLTLWKITRQCYKKQECFKLCLVEIHIGDSKITSNFPLMAQVTKNKLLINTHLRHPGNFCKFQKDLFICLFIKNV